MQENSEIQSKKVIKISFGHALAIVLVIIISIIALIIIVPRTSAQSGWISSYLEARDAARALGKDVLFCFTGSDWDEEGNKIFEALNDKRFMAATEERFILCRLDIVRDSSLMEEEALETNYLLSARYAIEGFPFFVLLTSEGDVYGRGVFSLEEDNPTNAKITSEALAFIASFDENRELIASLKEAIRASEGVEKVRRIDEFLSAIDPSQYSDYEELIRSVPALDPENESGLRGSYLLQGAWLEASALFQLGQIDAASGRFMDILSDPSMTAELRQEALYLAAGMHAASSDSSAEQIISLLEQSIDANPESANVEEIASIIEGIREQAESAETE